MLGIMQGTGGKEVKIVILDLSSCSQSVSRLDLWHVYVALKLELEL